jgi:DNA-binding transcriptional LysR family regulator
MTEMQMKCFLTLAEELNFTKASKTLCISQSTLSAHISALEKNIGAALFLRSNKKVTLSPEGCILYPAYKRAHEMIENATKEAKTLHDGHANILRIGFIDGMIPDERMNSLEVIEAFRKEHPSVQVQITSANENQLLEQIERDQVDVIFSFEKGMHVKKDLTGKIMLENPLCMLCETGRYTEKHPFNRDALAKETLIVITKETGPSEEEYVRQMLTEYDVEPQKILYVNSMEAKIFCIATGYGVGIADYMTRMEDRERFDLFPMQNLFAQYGFLRKKKSKNTTVKTFFDFLETYDQPLNVLTEIQS